MSRSGIRKGRHRECLSWDALTGPDLFMSAAREVRAWLESSARTTIAMLGGRGRGKSTVGRICVAESVNRLLSARIITAMDLMDDFDSRTRVGMTPSEWMSEWGSLDLLVVDDVTVVERERHKARMYAILDRRYESDLPSILIANSTVELLHESIGDSMVDRCNEGGIVMFEGWDSFRGKD